MWDPLLLFVETVRWFMVSSSPLLLPVYPDMTLVKADVDPLDGIQYPLLFFVEADVRL